MAIEAGERSKAQGGLALLLYVSRIAVDTDRLSLALADIKSASVATNTEEDITGLLIAAPRYFAQLLEGHDQSLEVVMARIAADRRHTDIRILRHSPIRRRSGGSWRLIRVEGGSFEERHVTPLLERAHESGSESSVTALMGLFNRLRTGTRIPTAPLGRRLIREDADALSAQ